MDEEAASSLSGPVEVLAWLLLAYGISIMAVTLSDRHVDRSPRTPFAAAGVRLVPWLLTWVLVFSATMLGLVLLIIPGLCLASRLFWADEFSLIHSSSPVKACRESFALTKGKGFAVFAFQFVAGFAEYLVLIPAVFVYFGILGGFAGLGIDSPLISFGEWFFSLLLLFLVYGSYHGPEVVYFYGLRAERAQATSDGP